ncbi:MAG: ribosomal RNA small subunit methyltransferase A [Candidatus Magasanikbacteria bacterium]|nr:ribosomal RNA small subunit methyltransferase A [Candidatus Magasanikbacteria bacterium]
MSSLTKPTHLKKLCRQYNLNPSKRYGQNFLITEKPVQEMIKAADVNNKDTVIEIGPGFGVLTFPLAEKGKKVLALEIEKKLKPHWEEKLKDNKNIEIVWGNALKNLSRITHSFHSGPPAYKLSNYKVVANLPYQITSHAIRTILELENKPEVIVLMVQQEVADRICAVPGDMSLLAVSVHYYGKPEFIKKIKKGCFWPEPKVDSAIIKITPKKKLPVDKEFEKKFFEMVKAGFANKRKQLAGNLSKGLNIEKSKIDQILIEQVGDSKVRAEDLSLQDWLGLTSRI